MVDNAVITRSALPGTHINKRREKQRKRERELARRVYIKANVEIRVFVFQKKYF